MRYILEGEWSGYNPRQRHIVHRTIINESKFKKINDQRLSFIGYSDGTRLDLIIREAKPREKIQEIHGYDGLIQDCLDYQCNDVSVLNQKKSQ